ncbi:Gluconolactonase precursor [Planctomycetes bacterium MalM25]|nr:Gluconolactonase precursor [Planctomycetes bacterium MalM25]
MPRGPRQSVDITLQALLAVGILAGASIGLAKPSTESAAEPHAVPPRPIGEIERLDPALDALIAPDAQVEVLADGFVWSEGPVWLPSEKSLVFSDVPENTVYRWNAAEGLSVYLRPSGRTKGTRENHEQGSNGLALDNEGRLLLCQHGDRCVGRMNAPLDQPLPQYTALISRHDGKRFNSPNDLTVHSSGSIFFTDPPYGLDGQEESPAKELPYQGVYRLDPDGEVTLLTDKLPRPNGITLSPDERTLYVAQSHKPAKIFMAYELDAGLGIKSSRLLFDANDLGAKRPGNPDGLKVDRDGNLFATGPGGVLVLSPDGKHLGTIMTGELIANCAFGDDGRTLYMTCDRYLCRVRLLTTGNGF